MIYEPTGEPVKKSHTKCGPTITTTLNPDIGGAKMNLRCSVHGVLIELEVSPTEMKYLDDPWRLPFVHLTEFWKKHHARHRNPTA